MKGQAIVRTDQESWFIKPGLHSHNTRRRLDRHFLRHKAVRFAQVCFFILGLCGIAYYGYSLADEHIYQAYENWAFDQHIAGRAATFADYLREKTPFGFLTGSTRSLSATRTLESLDIAKPEEGATPRPAQGSVLGRVDIGRLNLSAIVREGVDDNTLSRAVGHLPSTALPGEIGNFAIAAHRDTLFRALKDIQADDKVTFESSSGSYTYKVISTKIVKPSDLSVIQPEGNVRLLTMITCYPFYYVGAAPKRFIVQAKLVGSEAADSDAESRIQAQDTGPPGTDSATEHAGAFQVKPKAPKSANRKQPRHARGFSATGGFSSLASTRSREGHSPISSKTSAAHNKHKLWRKLLHRNRDE
ncbi:MAG: class D sortase [Acidobacteriaceae bacterium]|nr:class D sortase [Acidobacteriaceae bacterium]MBV9781832.1 class D sortase [Acidobacteriaceae bacterium]